VIVTLWGRLKADVACGVFVVKGSLGGGNSGGQKKGVGVLLTTVSGKMHNGGVRLRSDKRGIGGQSHLSQQQEYSFLEIGDRDSDPTLA